MPSPFNPLKLSLDSCCLEIDVHNRGNRCSPTQPENKIIKERRQEKEKGYHPLNIKTGFDTMRLFFWESASHINCKSLLFDRFTNWMSDKNFACFADLKNHI